MTEQNRRQIFIVLGVVAVLLCCCCLFLVSAYFTWGDPLMEALGVY